MHNRERWIKLKEFPGYKVSSLGNIKGHRGLMHSRINRYGYAQTSLQKDGTLKTVTVHKLVADTFLAYREGTTEVNHKDGNKLNNSSSNLERVSRLENMAHATQNGLRPKGEKHWTKTKPDRIARGDKNGARTHIEQRQGEHNSNSKLTEQGVRAIRAMAVKGIAQVSIAKKFGIAQAHVSAIILKKVWKKVV